MEWIGTYVWIVGKVIASWYVVIFAMHDHGHRVRVAAEKTRTAETPGTVAVVNTLLVLGILFLIWRTR